MDHVTGGADTDRAGADPARADRAGSEPTTDRIVVRPLAEADVEAAWSCAVTSLARMSEVYEPLIADSFGDRTAPENLARGHGRVRHLLATDPGGAWVAVDPAESPASGSGGRVVGIALALVRADLWFLSLLAVETGYQSQRIGRRLLDAALRHSRGVPTGWILASADPKALRRYQAAGFDLHPGYLATGSIDRTAVPAGLGVRDGDWDRDRELVDAVVTGLRGAPYGPDLDAFAERGHQLKIVDGEGYAILRPAGVAALGARSPEVARRLLWDALASATQKIELEWLVATQQWAIDLALAGRLSLHAGPSSCLRDVTAPMTPFLPSGAYG